MSAEIRAEIATAVETVDGIAKCSPYHLQTIQPGQAVVRRGRAVRDDSGFGRMHTWEVVLLLPQDLKQAELRLDELVEPLADAVEPVLVFLSLTPSFITVDGSQIPCIVLEGVRPN